MEFLSQERQAEVRAIPERQQKTYRQMLSVNKNKTFAPDGELAFKSLALISGVREAYAKAKSPLSINELGEALLIALRDPSCEERWFKGEIVFPLLAEDD